MLVLGVLQFNEVALIDSGFGINHPIMVTAFNTSQTPSTRSICQPPTVSIPAFPPASSTSGLLSSCTSPYCPVAT
eukprot:8182677-Ditylum_brightwellii.AAC.1